MIAHEKILEIDDLGNPLKFKIVPFPVLDGFQFMVKFSEECNKNPNKVIASFADDLIPLSSIVTTAGDVPLKMTNIGMYIQNPLTISKLCQEIFQFQNDFMNASDESRVS